MAKTGRNNRQRSRNQGNAGTFPLFLVLGGAAILIITAIFAFQPKPEPFTPEVTGKPSLQVDQEQINFGDVKLGKTVTASFKLKNVGDQPLRFSETPYIEVREGC
jgi:hypothetical protein